MNRLIDRLRRYPVEAWVSGALVLGSVLFMFKELSPSLLFLDTTPAGGDMGAHVWGPAYLKEQLLPHLRLSGWAPDWYAGFPAYQFYMVLPSLFIVLLNVVLFVPYNISFKLVSVSGLLALPVAAWALGRLARLPFPMPAALAVATVPFAFDRSFTIYGGNVPSTLAGEFSFTISLVFALLFLGLVLRGLETGRSRAGAAAMLGLTVLCHLIPAIFALVGAAVALVIALEWTERAVLAAAGAFVMLVVAAMMFGLAGPFALLVLGAAAIGAWAFTHRDRREEWLERLGPNRLRVWWIASAMGVGTLLSGFWTVPFVARKSYMTDMGWEKLKNYWEMLFPGHIGQLFLKAGAPHQVPGDMTLVIALAAIGVGTSIAFRRRFGVWLTAVAATLALGVIVAPQGRLWNARLLPFWYLCLYFLAAVAVVELISALAVLLSREPESPRRGVMVAGPIVVALAAAAAVSLPLWSLPFGHTSPDKSSYSWMGFTTKDHSFIPSWVNWNYSGYERKPAHPEYQELVSAMRDVGAKRGCGRAMWEYDQTLDRFGTPMAPMLLPYWTNGCIGSMEGLYFEASATTPYHFLNQSELSKSPSRAWRSDRYGSLNVALGVRHMQLMGVKYYMAFSDVAVAQANKDADLKLVDTVRQWRIYEVAHSELVQPIVNEPVVVNGVDKGGKTWLNMAVDWYLNPSKWTVMSAAGGPSSWQRINKGDAPRQRPYQVTSVTKVETGRDSIKFRVDRTGAPILIKTSYFPNWKATNAKGPYRVAPNLMVVIPTAKFVTLRYTRTPVDWLGIAMTLVGIWLAILLARRKRLRIPPPAPRVKRAPVTPRPWPGADEDELATVGGGPDREPWGSG